jgi:hypothetical protein
MKNVGLLLIAMLFLCGTVNADRTVWYVHPDSALNSIQAALDSCADNDIVLVAPGTFYENIVWPNIHGIHLTSEMGSEVTIIDGDSIGSVMEITSGVDSTTIVRGFTMQNGIAPSGGGIYCWNSSPSLGDVIINGNGAVSDGGGGGGIYCWNSSPSLTNVTISGNNARSYLGSDGGGIYCGDHSSPNLDNVTITGNSAGASGWLHGAGGGIFCCDSSSLSLNDVTISENSAMIAGGGIYCDSSSLSLVNVSIPGIVFSWAGVVGFTVGIPARV